MLSSTCAARATAATSSRAGLNRVGAFSNPAIDRAFEEVELARRFAEIAVRRGVDAIGAGAEIDPVEVDFEDLVLAEAMLEPQRQQSLADFAGEVALGRQEQDLGELLGDRAAALHDMAGAQIGDGGAQQTDRIDAEMAVETPVLGRDDRLRQIGRHLLQRQRLPEQIAEAWRCVLPSSARIVTLGRRSATASWLVSGRVSAK